MNVHPCRRLPVLAFCVVPAFVLSGASFSQDSLRPSEYSPRVRKILMQNIAPFWYPRSLDRTHGGYNVDFGPAGKPRPGANRMIVSQARMVWYFSRMVRAGLGDRGYLEAAELGFRFLRDKMWDASNGGFFWEVDATGAHVVTPEKHLYGQAFALYGISEYYLASHRGEVLEFANRIFDVLEARAHDSKYGGYLEYFGRDWSPLPPTDMSPMGFRADLKLMNTHLHLLEALTSYCLASSRPLARERLLELLTIETNTVLRKNVGACTDKYDRRWNPLLDRNFAFVSYGHDIENVWLVIDACKAAGVPPYPYLDLFRTLWDYSLTYGYDTEHGGFYDSGPFGRQADQRNKTWWVQAEALVSALQMYRLTGESKYLAVFDKTLGWVEKRQIDWNNGEWHWAVAPDGKTSGDKGNAWKAAYHTGRAMIECLELLRYPPGKRD